MRTFRLLAAINLAAIGLLSAGPLGLVLAVVGGLWFGAEIAAVKVESEQNCERVS